MAKTSSTNYDLNAGVPTGPADIEYPFADEQDYQTIIVSQPYLIEPLYYAPPSSELGDVLSVDNDLKAGFSTPLDLTNCTRISDKINTRLSNGLLQYSKRWARMPRTRDVPTILPFEIPGVAIAGFDLFEQSLVGRSGSTFIKNVGGALRRVIKLNLSDVTNYQVGTQAAIDATTATVFSTSSRRSSVFDRFFVTVTEVSGNTITCSTFWAFPFSDQSSYSFTGGTAFPSFGTTNVNVNRISVRSYQKNPKQSQVPGILRHTYSTQDPYSGSIDTPFEITSLGTVTSTLTATTNPTYSDYLDSTTNDSFLQVDYQTFKRWEGSNIWETITPYVRPVI